MSGYVGLSIEVPIPSSSWVLLRRYDEKGSWTSVTIRADEIHGLIVELRRQLRRIEGNES